MEKKFSSGHITVNSGIFKGINLIVPAVPPKRKRKSKTTDVIPAGNDIRTLFRRQEERYKERDKDVIELDKIRNKLTY